MVEALTVVGGSIASLAFSLIAARNGRQVNLYVDPKRIGGSFAGILCGEQRFDLGCRLFELDYESVKARPISSFDPMRDNHRPFIGEVAAFVREILGDDLQSAATPQMWINGRKTRCAFMTVDLSELPSILSAADRALVLEQTRSILSEEPDTKANGPVANRERDEQTLRDASLAQHGPRLHLLLTEAICAKQYAGWQHVLAEERRKLWAALFHPSTILEAFAGLPITFQPHRPFATTTEGSAHLFVRKLYQAVEACSRIAILPVGPLKHWVIPHAGTTHLCFGDGTSLSLRTKSCVMGVPPEQLFAATALPYQPERLTASVLWVNVPENQTLSVPSSLIVCDAEPSVLRISNAGSTPGWQSFAVEFGSAAPDFTIASAALRQMGLITDHASTHEAHRMTAVAQVAPTSASRTAFRVASRGLEGVSSTLLGGARRFGFESLNDQIVDALYYGGIRC